jgi:hypothetical protein
MGSSENSPSDGVVRDIAIADTPKLDRPLGPPAAVEPATERSGETSGAPAPPPELPPQPSIMVGDLQPTHAAVSAAVDGNAPPCAPGAPMGFAGAAGRALVPAVDGASGPVLLPAVDATVPPCAPGAPMGSGGAESPALVPAVETPAAGPTTDPAPSAEQVARDVDGVRAPAVTASEAEDAFFKRHDSSKHLAPKLESFADLDEDYEPQKFWDRVFGRKPKRTP